jgi:elongator complex protein 3
LYASKLIEISEKGAAFRYELACKKIAKRITQSYDFDKKCISKISRDVSSEFHLNAIPRRQDILRNLPENGPWRNIFKVKPVKTASGVAIVSVMAIPYPCPQGRCIYCPGGTEFNTPLSYVGSEPPTKIAQTYLYDPFKQIVSKLNTLRGNGHNTGKVELVLIGGTFPFLPEKYQRDFAKACYDALNSSTQSRRASTLQEAMITNERSKNKCVGLTVETKPDYCKQNQIETMLDLGVTRVEVGVQSLRDEVLHITNRGHDLNDVIEAFKSARNAGLKIVAHMMPGLPGSSVSKDADDLHQLIYDPRFRPDMLKIYPTLVLRNTGLHKLYSTGRYVPYTDDEIIKLLVDLKKKIPPWIRIMRIQREIEAKDIVAGPKQGNLRQIVLESLHSEGYECRCIRCREIGLKRRGYIDKQPFDLARLDYVAADGQEVFLSCETHDGSSLLAFLRLRKIVDPIDSELNSYVSDHPRDRVVAVVRELHVYGQTINVGMKANDLSWQHKGLGKLLLSEAERIAKDEFGVGTLSVISAVGTRKYYRMLGYNQNQHYVTKVFR